MCWVYKNVTVAIHCNYMSMPVYTIGTAQVAPSSTLFAEPGKWFKPSQCARAELDTKGTACKLSLRILESFGEAGTIAIDAFYDLHDGRVVRMQ